MIYSRMYYLIEKSAKALLPVICFMIFTGLASSQPGFRFKKISIAGGLSQNTVNCIFQDKKGLIWIGTQDGLNMYNGYTFRYFKTQLNDSLSISDNFILHITEDSLGYLWVATRNGLNRMDPSTFMFRRFYGPDQDRREFHNSFFRTVVLPGGYVLTRRNGFMLIHAPTLCYFRVLPAWLDMSASVKFQNFFSDQRSVILCSDQAISEVGYDQSVIHYPVKFSNEEYVTALLSAKDRGTFLIGTNRNLYLFENNSLSKILPDKLSCNVTTLIKANDNKFWAATSQGIFVINPNDNNDYFHIQPDKNIREGISSLSVTALHQTSNNQIWIGTEHNGINVFDPVASRFKFVSVSSAENSSKENVVWGIHAMSEKSIWIGVDDGLMEVAFSHPISMIIRDEAVNWKYTVKRLYPDKIKQRVSDIFVDDKQQVWITTSGDGIYRLLLSSGVMKHYEADTSKGCKITDNVLYHISPGNSGELYFSTRNGVTHYRAENESFQCVLPSSFLPEFNNFVLNTYWSSSRFRLYICQAHGLSAFQPDSNKLIHYKYNKNDSSSLSFPIVSSVCEDQTGNLWVSTLGGGICGWDEKLKRFFKIGKEQGLTDEVVYTLVPDQKKKIWFSTNTSVGALDPITNQVMMYPMTDVFSGTEFSQNSFHRTPTGNILFGGTGGFVMFHPDQFLQPDAESPLVLSDIKLNFRDVSLRDTATILGSFNYPEKILMNPGIRSVFFEIAALDYRNQTRIQYACRMQGYDQEWMILGNSQRSVLYSNLPFGNYVFQVKYRLAGQDWFPTLLQIPVEVIPPYYQTRTFRFSLIGLGIVLLIIIVRTVSTIRLRRKLRLAETQMRLQEERERISRELHDNIGSQLTYIINALDKITFRIKPQHIDQEKQRLEELSEFSRGTMQHLRETIFTLNKEKYDVNELADKIRQLASEYLKEFGLECQFNVTLSQERPIDPMVYLNLYRIVQEALQNIVKYANARIVKVDLQGSLHQLSLVISDDGKGFDMNAEYAGNGLANMKKRAQEIKAGMEIKSELGRGTQISILYKYDN